MQRCRSTKLLAPSHMNPISRAHAHPFEKVRRYRIGTGSWSGNGDTHGMGKVNHSAPPLIPPIVPPAMSPISRAIVDLKANPVAPAVYKLPGFFRAAFVCFFSLLKLIFSPDRSERSDRCRCRARTFWSRLFSRSE